MQSGRASSPCAVPPPSSRRFLHGRVRFRVREIRRVTCTRLAENFSRVLTSCQNQRASHGIYPGTRVQFAETSSLRLCYVWTQIRIVLLFANRSEL